MRKLLLSLGVVSLAVVAPTTTLAISSTSDYDYGEYDYSDSYDRDDSNAAAVALGIGFIMFAIISGLIGLAGFIFWLVMFIDLVKRNFDQKVLWVILMLVFGFWAAIFYYFMVKKKNITSSTKEVNTSHVVDTNTTIGNTTSK